MNKIYCFVLCCILLIAGCSSGSSTSNNINTAKLTKLGRLPNGALLYVERNRIPLTRNSAQKVKLSFVGGNNSDSYNIVFGSSQKQDNDINGITITPNSCMLESGKTLKATCEIMISSSAATAAGKYSITPVATSTMTGRTINMLPIIVLVSGSTLADTKDILHFTINDPRAGMSGTAYTGTIDATTNKISVVMPLGITLPQELVANFVTSGSSVIIGSMVQSSGVTSNVFDPNIPKVYTVVAADKTIKTYVVTVTAVKSSAKDLNDFIVAGQIGTTELSGNNITVQISDSSFLPLPQSISVATSFATTGVNVTVNGNIIKSGDDLTFSPGTLVTYTVTAADGSTQNYIVNIVILSSAKSLTNFSIPAQLSSTATDNNIAVIMPSSTSISDLEKLVAQFSISPNASITVTDPSGRQTAISGQTVSDFSQSATTAVTYTVTAQDGSIQAYNVNVTIQIPQLSFFAGNGKWGTPTPGPATSSSLVRPSGVAVDSSGNVYIADTFNNVIEKVDSNGMLTIFAGNGKSGPPTLGPATSSSLNTPMGITVDSKSNVYIADVGNNVIEKVDTKGNLTIFAGNGRPGTPTPGPAISSSLNSPYGVTVDSTGNVYIADTYNNAIEKVDTKGNLTIFAGNGQQGAPTPGPAISSSLNRPYKVAVDVSSNVYIADTYNNVIEKVDNKGNLTIFAGNGQQGTPIPGSATSSSVSIPCGVAVDGNGNVYIADTFNNVIEKVDSNGMLTIFVGTGQPGTPTPGSATSSSLNNPFIVAVDGSGNVYIADSGNNMIEKVK